MTENKRFRVTLESNTVRFVDFEENKQLMSISFKKHNDAIDCQNALKFQCDLLNDLNDEVKSQSLVIKGYQERTEKLFNENEQLKNKIDVLEDDNETYHKSLEKLNLYTKRFIQTKCTNEFKDCKTNRYYWLDHEGNFEGCLELLNLLDCEREVLKSENRQLKGRLMVYEEQMKGDVE